MYGPKHAYKDSVKKKTICKNAFRITVRDRQATKWRTSLEKFYGKGGCDCKISAYFQFKDHRMTTFLYKFKFGMSLDHALSLTITNAVGNSQEIGQNATNIL